MYINKLKIVLKIILKKKKKLHYEKVLYKNVE